MHHIHTYVRDFFFSQGERATSMFFISRGTVGVFVVPDSGDPFDTGGEEDYIISLGAGSFFGEVSLLEEVPYRTCTCFAEPPPPRS